MKEIPLTQGKVALVDDEDHERVMAMGSWCAHNRMSGYWYAVTGYKGKYTQMHRVLLDAPRGVAVDHINHEGLDNRRCNIRLCTLSQNQGNRKKQSGTSSKYKGVCWDRRVGKWQTHISLNGKYKYLGCFDDEDEAGRAYNEAAQKLFGEFALLNVLYGQE